MKTISKHLMIRDMSLLKEYCSITPSPTPKHQSVSRELEFELLRFVRVNNLGEIFDVPCDVYFDNSNVVQPDILFISKDRLDIIGEKNIQGEPDLIIEIISENTAHSDLVQKKKLYPRFGVKELMIFWNRLISRG